MDVDEVDEVFDAEGGEGRGSVLMLRVVNPDQPILRFQVQREIGEPVFALA